MPHSSPTTIAIAVVLQAEHILVGQRPEGVALAGLWEFPGGKVEGCESLENAAVRECAEETGLQVRVVEELISQEYRYDHGNVKLHFFICEPLDEGQTPLRPFRWVVRKDLSNYDFPPANRRVLELLASGGA